MSTYYCDGSQHLSYRKLAVGITRNNEDHYYETTDYDHKRCMYEIIAIKKAAEIAIKDGSKRVVIVNDDRNLVGKLDDAMRNPKSKGKSNWKPEFVELLELLKVNNIQVRKPTSSFDKIQIKRCHHLSRRYML